MLISNTLTYELTLTISQLEDMLHTQGVEENRISPNNKIIIQSLEHDPRTDTLLVEFQVLEKQDA